MNLAARLRTIRERRGLTGGQVATYVGVSAAHISGMESGRRQPSLELLARLASYFDCSTDYLLGLTDDSTPMRRADLPEHGTELVNLFRQLSELRSAELLDIATALYELEQSPTPGQPTLLEQTLKRIRHGDEARIIGEDSE